MYFFPLWALCCGLRAVAHPSALSFHPARLPPSAYLPYQASYMDLTVRHTGLLMGVGNTIATLPSFVSPLLTARMLDETGGSWTTLFYALAACNILGLVVYDRFVDTRALDDGPIGGWGGDSSPLQTEGRKGCKAD